MSPDTPWLVKCPHCQALVWTDKQKIVAKVDMGTKYENAKEYLVPNLPDYLTVLKNKRWGRKKRRYLHLRAWWAGNDRRRYSPTVESKLSPEESENLKTFYDLLDPTQAKDRVMMAEIERELGHFAAALELIEELVEDSRWAAYIKELAQKRVSRVVKII